MATTPVAAINGQPIAAVNEQSGAQSAQLSFFHRNEKWIALGGGVLIGIFLVRAIIDIKK